MEGESAPCDNIVIARLVVFLSRAWETLREFSGHLSLGMEDLTKHWSSLSLSDREGPGLCLKSEQAITEYGIVARFLTKCPLNIDAIATTFTPF